MIDIQELFNTKLPTALANNPTAAKQMKGTFLIVITGETGGSWFIDPISDPPTCTAVSAEADATLSISAENFQKLAANPKKQAPGMLLFGKLKIEGNKTLAMASATKLGELFGSK